MVGPSRPSSRRTSSEFWEISNVEARLFLVRCSGDASWRSSIEPSEGDVEAVISLEASSENTWSDLLEGMDWLSDEVAIDSLLVF